MKPLSVNAADAMPDGLCVTVRVRGLWRVRLGAWLVRVGLKVMGARGARVEFEESAGRVRGVGRLMADFTTQEVVDMQFPPPADVAPAVAIGRDPAGLMRAAGARPAGREWQSYEPTGE